jgi:hypothetical protein
VRPHYVGEESERERSLFLTMNYGPIRTPHFSRGNPV